MAKKKQKTAKRSKPRKGNKNKSKKRVKKGLSVMEIIFRVLVIGLLIWFVTDYINSMY